MSTFLNTRKQKWIMMGRFKVWQQEMWTYAMIQVRDVFKVEFLMIV